MSGDLVKFVLTVIVVKSIQRCLYTAKHCSDVWLLWLVLFIIVLKKVHTEVQKVLG